MSIANIAAFGGWAALDARKRGGRKPKLDAKAIRWIYDTVTMKNPLQLKFSFALWTAKMVGDVVFQEFGVKLSKASVCRLLTQLGLTPQRPIWRAYQQRPEQVKKWLEEEYPRIRALARRHKALIFFGDEAGVRSDHHAGTTWAIKGKTPIVSSTGARFGLNLISAVSSQGEFRFMTIRGRFASAQFIEFIKRLVHGVGKQVITKPEQLHTAVISYLRFIQKSPARVRSYYNNETTKYAA